MVPTIQTASRRDRLRDTGQTIIGSEGFTNGQGML